MSDVTKLNISLKDLQSLIDDIESDWGFEYSIDNGTRALVALRKLVGGEPNSNLKYEHQENSSD